MIDYPEAAWNRKRLTDNLARIICLLKSPVFKQFTPFSYQSQVHWAELIRTMGNLALQAGKCIDFTEDVSTQDKRQHTTSLLQSMPYPACMFSAGSPAHPHRAIQK